MKSALQMIAALVLGLAAGAVIAATGHPAGGVFVSAVEPFGLLFVAAIRMTVMPLITAKVVVAVASATDDRALKRLGASSVVIFLSTVGLAAAIGASISYLTLPWLGVATGPQTMTAFTDTAAAALPAKQAPDFARFLVSLVPANPFKSAVDDALLPLVVFAVAFGFALTRVATPAGQTVLRLFQGIGDAMVVLIKWIMRAAPLGIFALSIPLAARMGLAALGAVAFYVGLVAVVSAAFALLVLYPAAVLVGRVPLPRFARACAPIQALAFSSRSSLACLPVMVEQSREQLKLPEPVIAFFLPVAAAMFRAGSAIGTTIGALFLAHLYGVHLSPVEVVLVALTAVMTMFGSPGVPSGAVVVIVPILASAGVPVEGVGILLGVDTLPDMFRTTTNVTATMAGAVVVGRVVSSGAAGRPSA